jgi:hypothetical protein
MKKWLWPALVLLLCVVSISAQDREALLDNYQRSFEKAESLEVKLKVLQDSMKTGILGMGPLYLAALECVNTKPSELTTDAILRQLALLAADLTKETGYSPATTELWKLFKFAEDPILQISVLDTLGVIAGDDQRTIANLESWLAAQNTLQQSGMTVDSNVVAAAVNALGDLKKGSSFPVLFQTKSIGYSSEMSRLAEEALYSLEGNLKDSFMAILEDGELSEKLDALSMALKSEGLPQYEKAELAEAALSIGLHTGGANAADRENARQLRLAALDALSEYRWAKATGLAIEHFNTAILEYDREIVDGSYLLETIDGLGSMGTHEAAKRLALYLELLNTYKEHGDPVEEQIVLAVIENLSKLGDKVAFANLSYVDYLDYSKTVKKKALEAIDNLKW